MKRSCLSTALVIPEWQRRILDERLASMERNPEDEQPWEDVKAELDLTEAAARLSEKALREIWGNLDDDAYDHL